MYSSKCVIFVRKTIEKSILMHFYTLLAIAILLLTLSLVFLFLWLQIKRNTTQDKKSLFELKQKNKELEERIQFFQTECIVKDKEIFFKEEKQKDLSEKYQLIKQENEEKDKQIMHYKTSYAKAEAYVTKMQELLNQKNISIKDKENIVQDLNQEIQNLRGEIIHLQEKNNYLKEKNQEQQEYFQEIQKENLTRFESLANKVLKQNTEQLSEKQQKEIAVLLNPLKENLASFQKQVREVYEKENKMRFSLQEQVKDLMQLNHKLSDEAQKLTEALTTQSKVQGDWGELILEQILDYSGLTRDRHFFVQQAIRDKNGNIIKNISGQSMIPDVLVYYPGDRRLVIDAKCSLASYIKWVQAKSKKEEQEQIKNHLISIKRHIQDLNKKNYAAYLPSLDFVMMFIPNEGAYSAALHADPNLWMEAYQKKILLVSPSNLIAALKLIENLWTREQQNKNTQEIVYRGEQLYNKIKGFVEDFEKIGEEMERSQKVYLVAKNKLYEGRGNIIRQTEMLKELGAASS